MPQAGSSLSTPARAEFPKHHQIQLTDEFVHATLTQAGVGRTEYADLAEPGLRLRITSEGASWSLRERRPDGSRMRIPLGVWPEVSVDDARRRLQIAKQTLLAVAAGQPDATVRSLLTTYERRQLAQLRRGTGTANALRAALALHLDHAPANLTRRDVAEIVDRIAERAPIQANRTLAYMKAFFSWAVGRGYLETSPAATVTRPIREVARERAPDIRELVRIWLACSKLGYPFGPAVRLLLLTAMRRDEVGRMRVDELELTPEGRPTVWVLAASRSKNGRAIRVPLSAQAAALLEEALENRPAASDFVFTTTGDAPISGWSKAKRRLDAAIAVEPPVVAPWRIHDLRRSFATLACDKLQIDPAVADRCLNHIGSSTRSTIARVYGRSEMYAQREAALCAWATLIETAIGGG
jgi:integrase